MSGTAKSGEHLTGWDHVRQSITTILTTRLNTRVMRRDFGSEVPDLIDRPMTQNVIMALFAAVAVGLQPRLVDGRWYGEPRFALEQVEVLAANVDGSIGIRVRGKYLPKGHLGISQPEGDAAFADVIFN